MRYISIAPLLAALDPKTHTPLIKHPDPEPPLPGYLYHRMAAYPAEMGCVLERRKFSHKVNKVQYQAATGVPPGCVLSSPLTCIQMRLITTTFHGKIGTFEDV